MMWICDLVAFKLEQSGFEVVAVNDGLVALTSARERSPDLLLLEVMMPGMSGIDVCRELRDDPATAKVAHIAAVLGFFGDVRVRRP